MKSKIFGFLVFLLLTGCETTYSIRYTQSNPVLTQSERKVDLRIHAYPLKNPSPTVIYAHGCSGLDGAYLEWKNKLNNWGYNVVQPDSLKSRGVHSACATSGVVGVSHDDRLQDLLATAEWIKSQSWHKGNIGLIGFSMGGRAALNLASNGGDLLPASTEVTGDLYKNINISAVVAYYSFCQAAHKNVRIPTLILNGAEDGWTPPTWCNYIKERNELIDVKIYPGVYHGFDVPGVGGINRVGHRIQYDAIAAADAENRVRSFFDKFLK